MCSSVIGGYGAHIPNETAMESAPKMKHPFSIVKDFEDAVAEYTGAPYCVAVSSCTAAIFVCLEYHQQHNEYELCEHGNPLPIELPRHTYIGVAQSILNAGFRIKFINCNWSGGYDLSPLKINDSARRFTSGMFTPGWKICTSHHWSKILSLGHGGCILHDNKKFDSWARKFRMDGRSDGIDSDGSNQPIRGHHLYLLPELAASGLVRLYNLPKHNKELPNSIYPDLSQYEIFQ